MSETAAIELLVVWKQPQSRMRYQVGRLSRDRSGYHFRYELKAPRSLIAAKEDGFCLFPAFPDEKGTWTDTDLFPLFARRLPQSWSKQLYEALGLKAFQDLEFLGKTGGRVATDTIEFLEPAEISQAQRSYQMQFPIAGWRYCDGESVISSLTTGTKLTLELEKDNQYDPCGVKILSPTGVKLGYVPSIYAYYMDVSIEQKAYRAQVLEVGPLDDPQVRVIVDFEADLSTLEAQRFVPPELQRYAEALSMLAHCA